MRLFLFGYVVVALALNFMLHDPLFLYVAISSFPVAVYLLLSPRKKMPVSRPVNPLSTHEDCTQKASVSMNTALELAPEKRS